MNRLADEWSPYLRQHADNPVDWYPWGDEAFDRARTEDRPIFLSIGYSACHWCHVMAHESFEDPATADALNASFVSIKVDREERPDVDAVYMEAVQAITGSGGWPMSMFLTPDRRPFFGGTYFPPEGRHGSPSFRTVLTALTDVWDNRRGEVEEQADELSKAIASRSVIAKPTDGSSVLAALRGAEAGGAADPVDLLDTAVAELAGRFDAAWGGFGPAPKFPQPALIDVALRHAQRVDISRPADTSQRVDISRPADTSQRVGTGRPADTNPRPPGSDGHPSSLLMATTTLDAMAAGGIHDHLGGGFARYSTDVEWLVPHFEKMLYDQAGLLRAFLHGWQVTGRPEYLQVVEGIVGYVQRDLALPEGGICSAEDADSEGVEGKFYVWTPTGVAEAVSGGAAARSDTARSDVTRGAAARSDTARSDTAGLPDATVADAVSAWFGVTPGGNFEGSTILRRPVGAPLAGPPEVELGRRLLFDARTTRVHPGLDDKVLTEWNAMYAAALAEAAGATGNDEWSGTAVAIGEFLHDRLRRPADGRWLRSWQQRGGARHLAYAADYAWLVECFTRLAELTGQARWTDRAVATADALIDLFHDDASGGFFTTGHDAEALIVRTKDIFDGATPSANAVAAQALARLGALTGTDRYTGAATEVVELIGDLLTRHPTAFAHTLATAELLARGAIEVVVTGDRPDLVAVVRSRWMPGLVLAWGEPTPSPLWDGRDGDRAYVCRQYTCQLAAADTGTLTRQLAEEAAGASAGVRA